MLKFVVVCLFVTFGTAWGRNDGPPNDSSIVCNDISPDPNQHIDPPSDGDGGFNITTDLTIGATGFYDYAQGQTYDVQVSNTDGTTQFAGFLVQARNEAGDRIGMFTPGTNQRIVSCSIFGYPEGSSIGHSASTPALVERFTWTAPADGDGVVNFRYAVVVERRVYYSDLSAAVLIEVPTTPPPPPPMIETPNRDPDNYTLTFREPADCNLTDCVFFAGIDVNTGNPDYLDIYIEGDAASWVAVGFTDTPNMFSADVLACNIDTNGDVELLDTWNLAAEERGNVLDTVQDVYLFSGNVTDGRISCLFARAITGSDVPDQDLTLNQDYYVLYGGNTNTGTSQQVVGHPGGEGNPSISVSRVNPAAGTIVPPNVTAPVRELEDYRLTLRFPDNCDPSSCDLFVGVDTNLGDTTYLDVYMEGTAQGWLAVGFSETADMFGTDVLGCNVVSGTSEVVVLDTWNPVAGRTNQLDAGQDVIPFTTSFVDGRIMCTFARSIVGSDNDTDLDLDTPYFILYGMGPTPGSGSSGLAAHVLGDGNPGNPNVSTNQMAPINARAAVGGFPGPVELPRTVTEPVRDAEEYRIIATIPNGCSPPSSCDLFVGVDTNLGNTTYLDVYMEGTAQGWLAVGFSETADMFGTDVLGCNVVSGTSEVVVLDTWNPVVGRNNELDAGQDVIPFTTSFVDGRIMCTFVRSIVGSDSDTDFNLNTPYFILYGVGPNPGSDSSGLSIHDIGAGNPSISTEMVDPATATVILGASTVREMLTRAHGILMLIAWPLMAVTAIFFAAWMRPALPNGEWFKVHRAFMIGSVIVGSVGFFLIFVAQYRQPTPGLISLNNSTSIAHFVIGIIVMALHIINPIISIFRCHPGKPNRWIFNLLHGSIIGMGAEILALSNVGIGIALFSQNFSIFGDLTIFYVYIAYIVFFISMIFVLFLIFTVISYISNDEDRAKLAPSVLKPLIGQGNGSGKDGAQGGVELAVPGQKPDKPAEDKPKVPSQDSPLRWVGFAVFGGITIPVMIVLIILVAV